ncbi:MAG: crossover junction endodeoxyribonuclease RuvC [Anaerolineales bacterium]
MSKARVVIGIDPGTAITGYGLVRMNSHSELEGVDYGVVTTPSDWEEPRRLLFIYNALREIVDKYHPESCAVENIFFQRNVRTAIRVGQGRGAALIAMATSNLPMGEYTPSEIKQAVVGYGNADKNQVQQMVKLLLDLDEIPQPDDAADALAVAICHLHTSGNMTT